MFKKCIIKIIILCLVAFGVNAENKVVLFGDSLMAGYGLNKEDHLSTVLQKNLNNNGLDVRIINASVSGDTTAGGLNRINWTLSEKNIDILVLGLGANDMLRGIKPKETKENLEKIIKIIIDKNIKAQDLINIISSVDKSLIQNVKIFDVYEGENIPEGKKSIALNVTIQSNEKTLIDKDLENINNLIIKSVEDKTGAKIRS